MKLPAAKTDPLSTARQLNGTVRAGVPVRSDAGYAVQRADVASVLTPDQCEFTAGIQHTVTERQGGDGSSAMGFKLGSTV